MASAATTASGIVTALEFIGVPAVSGPVTLFSAMGAVGNWGDALQACSKKE